MYTRKTVNDAMLQVFMKNCTACNTKNIIKLAPSPHRAGILGVTCSDCAATAWFDADNSSILKGLFTIQECRPDEYRKKRKLIYSRFLNNLPLCPLCNSKFEKIITNVVEYPTSCIRCGQNIPSPFIDVTSDYFNELVWWIDPIP